jgi:hypothetical protein
MNHVSPKNSSKNQFVLVIIAKMFDPLAQSLPDLGANGTKYDSPGKRRRRAAPGRKPNHLEALKGQNTFQ